MVIPLCSKNILYFQKRGSDASTAASEDAAKEIRPRRVSLESKVDNAMSIDSKVPNEEIKKRSVQWDKKKETGN